MTRIKVRRVGVVELQHKALQLTFLVTFDFKRALLAQALANNGLLLKCRLDVFLSPAKKSFYVFRLSSIPTAAALHKTANGQVSCLCA